MVKFATYSLPYVQEAQLQKAWVTIEKPIPFSTIGWRRNTNNLGRQCVVLGKIKSLVSVADFLSQINTMRSYVDGTKRTLDLEDGTTPTFQALMSDPQFTFAAGSVFDLEYWTDYQVTFLEA